MPVQRIPRLAAKQQQPKMSTGVKQGPPRGGFQVGVGRGMGTNATGIKVLANQASNLQDRIRSHGGNAPIAQQRLKQVNRAIRLERNPAGGGRDLGSMRKTPEERTAINTKRNERLGLGAGAPAGVPWQPGDTSGQLPDDMGGQTPPPQEEAWNGGSPISEDSNGPTGGGMDEMNPLFPSIRAMEPANYEGSPLYKFQQQQGEDRIKKLLNKRGLLNSGAEIEAISDFNTELGAVEADKARGYAEKEADRLERIQQNEALRRERGENRASDDRYRWTDLMLRQNPMEFAYGGMGKYGDTLGRESSAIANYLRNAYPRVSGGGGGGGGVGPFIPPFPTSPDFSGIDIIGSIGQGTNNTNYWDSILKGIGALFQ